MKHKNPWGLNKFGRSPQPFGRGAALRVMLLDLRSPTIYSYQIPLTQVFVDFLFMFIIEINSRVLVCL